MIPRRTLLTRRTLSSTPGFELASEAADAVAGPRGRGPTSTPPLFDDKAAIRVMNRESILLLGGGRALLMQLAHPQVAAGVAAHSSFRDDRLGRFLRTVRPVYAMVFGTAEESTSAAARIARRHRPVVGPGYRADDPDLQRWVYATLVDTVLTTYDRFVRRVSPELEARFLDEASAIGRQLGIPRELLPHDPRAFQSYVDGMVASLEVSDAARALVEDIFAPRPLVAAPALRVLRELTSGLLPAPLREQFGLRWGPRRETLLNIASLTSRNVWPRLPRGLREPPPLLMPRSTAGRR
ncbi:MAG: oxygenase MpaB family protein [Dehalococcoidia bacterium]